MGLCERCKKAQATFHLTNIDPDGEKTERHLCDRCAIEEGLIQIHKPTFSSEFVENFVQNARKSKSLGQRVCEHCGISYVEFRNQGLLGCAHDYDVFREALEPLIQRAHDGATHHVGKTPRSLGSQAGAARRLARLRRQLKEAVAAEDYERAAKLRDEIQELESQ